MFILSTKSSQEEYEARKLERFEEYHYLILTGGRRIYFATAKEMMEWQAKPSHVCEIAPIKYPDHPHVPIKRVTTNAIAGQGPTRGVR